MDRRSWLWRRKSSEKNHNGETESSGSGSSHSERLSDDQTLSTHNSLSPDVTSKAAFGDEEVNDNMANLSEKLSKALLEICAKEDEVKQHAKVAEEAVSGWERAENEVLILKKQNDALTHKNRALEQRVEHLDGALKECLRQLRQEKDEQEDNIHNAISKKICEWEFTKSELENQLIELHSQLQDAEKEDNFSKFESFEKENSILKLKLEQMTYERDLSTIAAETASKNHLHSIKKVAKLEAECRRLKMAARKMGFISDHHSITTSSDGGLDLIDFETSEFKNEIKPNVRSVETGFLDDFLEMEKFAALPEEPISGVENPSRSELESWINRTNEIQENLEKTLREKVNLEISLNECRNQLKESEGQIKNLSAQLAMANEGKKLAEKELEENPLRAELESWINRTNEIQENLEKTLREKVKLEISLNECRNQLKESEGQIKNLGAELAMVNEGKKLAEKELGFMRFSLENSRKLLDEAGVYLVEIENQLNIVSEERSICEVQLECVNTNRAELESKLRVMEHKTEVLNMRICSLEDEVKEERILSKDTLEKCCFLESDISRMKLDSQSHRSQIIEELRINKDKELALAASKFSDCQKTITSIGWQLKSLATLEDFLIDS